jgi:hypothetical protein
MEAEADDVTAQCAEESIDTNIKLLILLRLLPGKFTSHYTAVRLILRRNLPKV